jgi:hypothetical protein
MWEAPQPAAAEKAMTIKEIVVALSVLADEDRGREYGLGMAVEFGAHVDGVIYALEPPPLFTINPEFVRVLMERHRAEVRRSANTVIQAFVKPPRSVPRFCVSLDCLRHWGAHGKGLMGSDVIVLA